MALISAKPQLEIKVGHTHRALTTSKCRNKIPGLILTDPLAPQNPVSKLTFCNSKAQIPPKN